MESVTQLVQRLRETIEVQNTRCGSTPVTRIREVECPLCNDLGLILKERGGEVKASVCPCREQKKIKQMIQASELTEDQRQIKIGDFHPTPETAEMFELVKRYLDEFRELYKSRAVSKGLALGGWNGVGKTMLVTAIGNALLEWHIPVVFVVVPDLMDELKVAQFEAHGLAMEQKIQTLSKVDVVIFDDVGKEKPSEWVAVKYFRIIDTRYRLRLPTIFTTNYNFDQMAERLNNKKKDYPAVYNDEPGTGDAVASRLYAMTKGRQAWCEAADYRLQENNKWRSAV